MSNPLRLIRKYQKRMLAVFVILLMLAFVLQAALTSVSPNASGGREGKRVVVTWAGGRLTNLDVEDYRLKHQASQTFLGELARRVTQDGGFPLVNAQLLPIRADDAGGSEDVLRILMLAKYGRDIGMEVSEDAVLEFLDAVCGNAVPREEYRIIAKQLTGGTFTITMLKAQLKDELLALSVQSMATSGMAAGFSPIMTPVQAFDFQNRSMVYATVDIYPVSNVKITAAKPSTADLKRLYKQGQANYEDITGKRPGFRLPRRVTVEWFSGVHGDFAPKLEEIKEEDVKAEYDRWVKEQPLRLTVVDSQDDQETADDTKTDDTKTDDTKTDDTKTDDTKTDDTKTDDTKTDDTKTDEAKTDEAKTDEAKTDEAKTDEAKTDEAKTDEAKTDEAKTDEAKTDEAKTDEAKTDEAKTDEAKTDEAKTDDTKTDDTKTDEAKQSRNRNLLNENLVFVSTQVEGEPASDKKQESESGDKKSEGEKPETTKPEAAKPAADKPSSETKETVTLNAPQSKKVDPPAKENPATEKADTPSEPVKDTEKSEPAGTSEQPSTTPPVGAEVEGAAQTPVAAKPPRLRTLEEAENDIRESLANALGQQRLEAAILSAQKGLEDYYNERLDWEYETADSKKKTPEPKRPNFQATAKKLGLKYVSMKLVDQYELSESAIGTERTDDGNSVLASVFSTDANLYNAELTVTKQFIFWVSKISPTHTPKFEDCEKTVLKFWTRREQFLSNQAAAGKLVKSINGGKNLADVASGDVFTTNPFLWMTSALPFSFGRPQLGEVSYRVGGKTKEEEEKSDETEDKEKAETETDSKAETETDSKAETDADAKAEEELGELVTLEGISDSFMETVFSLSENKAAVVSNLERTQVYVVQLKELNNAQSILGREMIISRTQQDPSLLAYSYGELQSLMTEWMQDLHDTMNVEWK